MNKTTTSCGNCIYYYNGTCGFPGICEGVARINKATFKAEWTNDNALNNCHNSILDGLQMDKKLKKKILSIVRGAMLEAEELPFIETTDNIADALIAAGIGDVKEAKFESDHYWRMWQGALVELERAEHRAEVAEKAGRIIQRDMARVFDVSTPRICELIANIWDFAKKQAEKELQEKKK